MYRKSFALPLKYDDRYTEKCVWYDSPHAVDNVKMAKPNATGVIYLTRDGEKINKRERFKINMSHTRARFYCRPNRHAEVEESSKDEWSMSCRERGRDEYTQMHRTRNQCKKIRTHIHKLLYINIPNIQTNIVFAQFRLYFPTLFFLHEML